MKRKRAPTSESAFPCEKHERKRLRDEPELFSFAIKRPPLRRVPPHSRTERTQVRAVLTAQAVRAAFRRCRGIHISPFRRRSPGILPFWHVMPWSLHFTARKRKVAKKRGRRPGEKFLSPKRRSAQPVIPCQRISGLNVSAIFRRDNTGCGTRPGVRSPDGAPCAATGIFLMAGVTQPLTHRAANTVRRLKNKKAAHTVRPAPTPGPLTLTLAFPIHFDNRIKEITRLRTLLIYSPEPAPSVYYRQ